MAEERKTSLGIVTENIEKVLDQVREDIEDNPIAPQYMHYIRMIGELMPTAVMMLGALNDKIDMLSDVLISTISSSENEEEVDETEVEEDEE